jgi:erythromycin esterase-like protein
MELTDDVHAGEQLIKLISVHAQPLVDAASLDRLMAAIGSAQVVMLGEASHGTHEYYTWRTAITKRLIQEKNFNFIGVEGDWPDCYNLNRYLKHYPSSSGSLQTLLHEFDRWPSWMWGNWEIAALAEWLHDYNGQLPLNRRIGFYGLDVYSLWESMDEILHYLEKHDPEGLTIARQAYLCFEPFMKDEGQSYAQATALVPGTCEEEVIRLLQALHQKENLFKDDPENDFNNLQNAHVAVNAEKYYRAMLHGGPNAWNIRDQHMFDTLQRLLEFHGPQSKAVIWAHNTHVGDARATDMADDGMYNIGELARELFGDGVFLVGFGSYQGTVIAGKKWGSAMKKMKVPPAEYGSWEYFLHQAGGNDKLLIMKHLEKSAALQKHIDHRAIGVVYNPEFEKYGNYVPSLVASRYDAFLHIDQTTALHPFHIQPDGSQMPETYPFGV